jgi:hypothetical protein
MYSFCDDVQEPIDLSELHSMKNSTLIHHPAKNHYYNLKSLNHNDLNASHSSLVSKSIIPEIDFTNKYVRRNQNYQSGADS